VGTLDSDRVRTDAGCDAIIDAGLTYRNARVFTERRLRRTAIRLCIRLQSKLDNGVIRAGLFGKRRDGGGGWPSTVAEVRVVSAEVFVSNSRGASPTRESAVGDNLDAGLRTLSGGQYAIEVAGLWTMKNGPLRSACRGDALAARRLRGRYGNSRRRSVTVASAGDDAEYCHSGHFGE